MKSQYFMSFFCFFPLVFLTFLPALPEPSDPEPSSSPSTPCQRQPGSLWHSLYPWARRAAQNTSRQRQNTRFWISDENTAVRWVGGGGGGSGGRLFPAGHVIGRMPSRFRKREMISRRQNLDHGHLYGETCVLSEEMQRAWPCRRHRGERAGMFCRRIQN